jgi:urease accessory protein
LVAERGPHARTFLSRRRQRFPLRLTTPLYLDPALPGMASLYVQNPTGGVFEDDRLSIGLRAAPRAMVHLTSQGATKAYRAGSGCASQDVAIQVSEAAFVEYVPDSLIPHAGARFEQLVTADVAEGGALIATEMIAPGRLAHGEAFEYTSLSLSTRVLRDGMERAFDSLELRPADLDPQAAGVMGGNQYLATLFVVSPGRSLADLVTRLAAPTANGEGTLAGCGLLPGDNGLILRMLSRSSRAARAVLLDAWTAARLELIGHAPPRRRK